MALHDSRTHSWHPDDSHRARQPQDLRRAAAQVPPETRILRCVPQPIQRWAADLGTGVSRIRAHELHTLSATGTCGIRRGRRQATRPDRMIVAPQRTKPAAEKKFVQVQGDLFAGLEGGARWPPPRQRSFLKMTAVVIPKKITTCRTGVGRVSQVPREIRAPPSPL